MNSLIHCSLSTTKIAHGQHGSNSVELAPNEHYSPECPNSLRAKFAGSSVLAVVCAISIACIGKIAHVIIRPAAQLSFRAIDLIQLNFYTRGYEEALHHHLSKMKTDPSLRGQSLPPSKLVCSVTKYLAYSVAKCVFFPLYLIGIEITSFIGVFLPIDARRAYCRLDQLFYVHPIDPYAPATKFEIFSNLGAPCMQTKEFRKEKNLFRLAPSNMYHPHTPLTLYSRLSNEIEKMRCYFDETLMEGWEEPLTTLKNLMSQYSSKRDSYYANEIHNKPEVSADIDACITKQPIKDTIYSPPKGYEDLTNLSRWIFHLRQSLFWLHEAKKQLHITNNPDDEICKAQLGFAISSLQTNLQSL